MSFMKRLFVVRNVRKIVAFASVLGIIFLSCAIIDKDNTIAQAQENYRATSYIKIDGNAIKITEGILAGNFGIRESLNRARAGKGNFTLIEIVVGKKSFYILGSDVCISEQIIAAEPGPAIAPEQLEQENQNLENKFLYLEVPGKSCYKLNSRWI